VVKKKGDLYQNSSYLHFALYMTRELYHLHQRTPTNNTVKGVISGFIMIKGGTMAVETNYPQMAQMKFLLSIKKQR
jgi:hypothetical protein